MRATAPVFHFETSLLNEETYLYTSTEKVLAMLVTAPVCHCETSPLNAAALANAKEMRTKKLISFYQNQARANKKKRDNNKIMLNKHVLECKHVTAAVFHFEISALNAAA